MPGLSDVGREQGDLCDHTGILYMGPSAYVNTCYIELVLASSRSIWTELLCIV